MERVRTHQNEVVIPLPATNENSNENSDTDHDAVQALLAHADQLMDSLGHLDAEDYLHQNRQSGGQ